MANLQRKNKIFIVITIFALLIIGLRSFTQYDEGLRIVGFSLFTLLCIGMAIINRSSKGKLLLIFLFWIFFGVLQFID